MKIVSRVQISLAAPASMLSVALIVSGCMQSGFNTNQSGITKKRRSATEYALVLKANQGLTVNEGSTANPLSASALAVTDEKAPDAEQTFAIETLPSHGSLKLNGAALKVGGSFTATALAAAKLTYDHDGSETTTDSFKFNVKSAAGGALDSTQFAISITPVNDLPVLATNAGMTVSEASAGNSLATKLGVTDADQTAAQLTYTLGSVPGHGALVKSGVTLAANATFSQANLDAGQITYTHDGSQTTSDSFTFSVADGAGGTISLTTFTISIGAVNDAPVLATNAGLTLNEGATSTIAATTLSVSDADNTTAERTFTVTTAPTNGWLIKSAVTLAANATFTQADINAGNLSYKHNGLENIADSFTFTVADGAGGTIGSTSYAITVTPVNDPPILAFNNGITVNEGSSANTIAASKLSTSEADNTAAETVFTMTIAPTHGWLINSGTTLAANGTFTQANIDANNLKYTHDGSETTSDSFTFTVSDGAGGSISATSFAITITAVNDAPVVGTNTGVAVNEGSTANIIATAQLEVTDADNTAAERAYTMTVAPTHGWLMKSGVTLAANGTFTQADIDANNLRYTHDGSETSSDSFTFTVSDGAGGSIAATSFALSITAVNDAPVLATNTAVTISEGGNFSLTSVNLETTDVDNTVSQLTYTVTTAPAHGSLVKAGVTLAANSTFTQSTLNAGNMFYQHDGGETTSDSFGFKVGDGAGSTLTGNTFSITITPANDAPSLTTNTGLSIYDLDTGVAVSSSKLAASDPDNTAAQISFTIMTPPIGGRLLKNGVTLAAAGTFTQADIDNGLITYNHVTTGTTSDSVTFSINDGAATISGQTFSITISPATLDLEVPIEMVDRGIGSSPGGVATYFNRTMTSFNAADYDGTRTYRFEIVATNTDSTAKSVYLQDAASANTATISVPAGTTVPTRFTATWTPTAVAPYYYGIRLQNTTSDNQLSVYSGRMIVKQSAATKTRLYVPLTAYDYPAVRQLNINGSNPVHPAYSGIDRTASTTYTQGKPEYYSLWKKDTSVLSTLPTDNTAFTLEAVLGSGYGGTTWTSSVGLFNATTGSQVVRASDSNPVEVSSIVSSGELKTFSFANNSTNFTDLSNFEVRLKTSAGSAWVGRAGLWIKLTSLAKAQVQYRIGRRATTNSSLAYGEQRAYIDTSVFSHPAVYHEVVGREPVSGTAPIEILHTGTSESVTSGSGTGTIATSSLEFDSTTKGRVRSSSTISITDQYRYIPQISCTSGSIDVTSDFVIVNASR